MSPDSHQDPLHELHQAARIDDLSESRGMRVCIKCGDQETPILLVRDGEAVHAFSADCPHAGALLEEGAVCDGKIVCPWHKGTFDLRDGSLIEPLPLKGLTRYPVTLKDGEVFVGLEPQAPHAADKTMLIVSSGAAGAAACAILHETGFARRIVMAGHDAPMPYDRTSLSKFVISGEMPVDDTPPLLDDDFFACHAVERIDSNAVHLDALARHAELVDGRKIDYDIALVCTSGTPKPLDIPGANLAHVHMLRRIDDARAIVESLDTLSGNTRAVIVGASFIGLEVASSLRKRGVEVSVVAPGKVPFEKSFGTRIGEMFRKLHEKNGVTFYMNAQVKALRGGNAVSEVMLDSGERITANLVIVGTGVKPGYGEALRIEHWRVAQQQARIAAFNMAGIESAYDGVPYFWTYHYGKNFDYLGHVDAPDYVEIDGDLGQQKFIAYLLKDGAVRAIVACEHQRAVCRLAEAMRTGLTLESARSTAQKAD